MWIEKNDPTAKGVCLLDSMTPAQVVYVIERDERARADLFKITSDPELLELAQKIERLPTENEDHILQQGLNKHTSGNTLPFYAFFRGQPPFAQ